MTAALNVDTVDASLSLTARWSSTSPESIGYTFDDVGSFSADRMLLVIFYALRNGRKSINCQFFVLQFEALASAGLTMFQSLSTAQIGQRNSTNRLNMSYAEFHLILQCGISWIGEHGRLTLSYLLNSHRTERNGPQDGTLLLCTWRWGCL